jgi:ABC-type lipoprotein export system ATPase subunit
LSIELRGASKSYGTTKAVKEASLTANAGSSLCIQGRNGSGKSTLLKIVALITTSDTGSIIFNGVDLTKKPPGERERIREEQIGYSFQEPLLIPYLTAIENVLLANPSSASSNSREAQAKTTLSALGLSDRMAHATSKLSGGEKKRVDLARAILRRTKILITDEPLSNLDPDSAELVKSVLRDFKEGGGLVVSSASDPADARWADRVLILD